MPTSNHTVLLSQTAVKQLHQLPSKSSQLITDKLHQLQHTGLTPRPDLDIKKLRTSHDPPFYRLRVGDYRIIFTSQNKEIRVTEILHRSKAYRWLD